LAVSDEIYVELLIILATLLSELNCLPADYTTQQDRVLIALQSAFIQLLHSPTAEEATIDTVMRGGDTDTRSVRPSWGLTANPEKLPILGEVR
jgi:ADP-ribosylglycohydrolase